MASECLIITSDFLLIPALYVVPTGCPIVTFHAITSFISPAMARVSEFPLWREGAAVVQCADDTQVLVNDKKSEIHDVISQMERVLATLHTWFQANGLSRCRRNPTDAARQSQN